MYYTMSYASPLGAMTLAANETALVGLWFEWARNTIWKG